MPMNSTTYMKQKNFLKDTIYKSSFKKEYL